MGLIVDSGGCDNDAGHSLGKSSSIDDTIKEDKIENAKLNLSLYTIINFGTGLTTGLAIDQAIQGNYKGAAIYAVCAIVCGISSHYHGKDVVKDIENH